MSHFQTAPVARRTRRNKYKATPTPGIDVYVPSPFPVPLPLTRPTFPSSTKTQPVGGPPMSSAPQPMATPFFQPPPMDSEADE